MCLLNLRQAPVQAIRVSERECLAIVYTCILRSQRQRGVEESERLSDEGRARHAAAYDRIMAFAVGLLRTSRS